MCFAANSSAGKLSSGKRLLGYHVNPLDPGALHAEFRNHRVRDAEEPTALISVSTNFLRVVHIAYLKLWSGEDADSIEFFFILPSAAEDALFHSAKSLAQKTGASKEDIKILITNICSNGKYLRNLRCIEFFCPLCSIVDSICPRW